LSFTQMRFKILANRTSWQTENFRLYRLRPIFMQLWSGG
jgi:hypothetical protein